MAFINYDFEENALTVIKVNGKIKEDFEYIEQDVNYKIIKKKEKFIGVKIASFFSDNEKRGRYAENVFKDMLDQSNISYLYIGQGPTGIEVSQALIETAKRPDFLINLPDIGTLLIDVKYRRKIGFLKSKKIFFPIFKSEVQSLINLNNQILIPVWLAFYEEDLKRNKKYFHLISISLLEKYINSIENNYSEREKKLNSVIRIPNELFYRIENELVFKIGDRGISEHILSEFSLFHLNMIENLEKRIKSLIKNNNLFKTKVPEKLSEKLCNDLFFQKEVEVILEQLINERIIDFKAKKPLRLLCK